MSDFNIPIVEPTIDYTKVPPINQKRTIAFINHFIAHTIIFLNKFALSCEEKLFEFENKLQKIEAALEIIEERLSCIPKVEHKLQTENSVVEDEKKNKEKKLVINHEIGKPNDKVPIELKLEENQIQSSSDPHYIKFFKMIQFGVPKQVVQLSMEQEGLDSSVLDNPYQLVQKSESDKNSDIKADS